MTTTNFIFARHPLQKAEADTYAVASGDPIKFDLCDVLPSGAAISSASISVNKTTTSRSLIRKRWAYKIIFRESGRANRRCGESGSRRLFRRQARGKLRYDRFGNARQRSGQGQEIPVSRSVGHFPATSRYVLTLILTTSSPSGTCSASL